MCTAQVEEKAVALHAVARVLGPPPNRTSSPSHPLASASGEDEDEAMENDPAISADREERSALARKLFDKLGACNGGQATGALLAVLVRQPVPEVRLFSRSSLLFFLHIYGSVEFFFFCHISSECKDTILAEFLANRHAYWTIRLARCISLVRFILLWCELIFLSMGRYF